MNTGGPAGSPLGLGNIPQLSFSGGFVSGSASVSNLGGAIDQPSRTARNTFQVVGNVSHTTARHVFKVGADIRYTQLNRLYDLAFSGQVSFSGTSNPEASQTLWSILLKVFPAAPCSLWATPTATFTPAVSASLARIASNYGRT